MKIGVMFRDLSVSASLVLFVIFFATCSDPNQRDILTDEQWEEAVERMVPVVNALDPIFLGSDSLEEMFSQIDKIKEIDNVVDAYVGGRVLYVKIDGWGTIGYPFENDEWDLPISTMDAISQEIAASLVQSRSDAHHPYSDYSACVLNAQHHERDWTRDVANVTDGMFRSCGLDVRMVDHHPTPDFFRSEIYDYDLIFYIGHGSYDEQSDLHWVETAETFVVYDDIKQAKKQNSKLYNINNDDEIRAIRFVDKRDSNAGIVFRYSISEKFIGNTEKRFAEDGKAVIFMVPCQTLMGDKLMHDDRPIDDAFAKEFFKKGAGMYIGYDESSSGLAQFGGMRFFANLLSGMSFENALITPVSDDALLSFRGAMDPDKTHFIDPNATYTLEHCENYFDDGSFDREWIVARHVLIDNGFRPDSYIMSPQMMPEDDYSESLKKFSAYAYYSPDVFLFDELNFIFVEPERLRYGFSFSKGTDPSSGNHRYVSVAKNSETHEVNYRLTLHPSYLEPNSEYHIWPFIADGGDLNYGNEIVFTTGELTPGGISKENLVAYYPFDGNADDMSGLGNHGALGGNRFPQLTTDRFGNVDSAYDFGGYYNSGWIRVPNSESLVFDKEFTVSFWIQHSELAGMDGWGSFTTSSPGFAAFCKAGDGNATYPGLYIMTGKGENGQGLSVSTNNSNGNAHNQSNWNHSIGYSKRDYELGNWLHIVLVVNDIEKVLYLDGEEVARDNLNKGADFTSMNSQDIFIGVMGGSTGWGASRGWYPFYGKIDDIMIFNCALDEQDVELLYCQ